MGNGRFRRRGTYLRHGGCCCSLADWLPKVLWWPPEKMPPVYIVGENLDHSHVLWDEKKEIAEVEEHRRQKKKAVRLRTGLWYRYVSGDPSTADPYTSSSFARSDDASLHEREGVLRHCSATVSKRHSLPPRGVTDQFLRVEKNSWAVVHQTLTDEVSRTQTKTLW